MQDVNDDMDLFRRAAEDYPLNTDSADFNEVLKKLSAEQAKKTIAAPVKKRSYKSLLLLLLLLLLLIPIGWILIDYSFKTREKRYGNLAEKNERKISTQPPPENIITDKTIVKPVSVTKDKPSSKNAVKIRNDFQSNSGYNQAKRSMHVTPNINNHVIRKEPYSVVAPDTDQIADKKEEQLLSSVNNKDETNDIKNKVNGIKNSDEKPLPIILNDDKKEIKKSDSSVISQEAIKNKIKKKTQKRKEHGLYAGVIISPDISTIKFQSIKNIGVSFGLLAGYQFSKKLSVESGISWDKKFYYSDGKYFNTKKIYLPDHAYIKDVKGLCKMIELPVTVRYNFKQSGKTNFSTAIGLSSYFIKREIYDYTIKKYGEQYPYHSDYKSKSTNLFAVINVSAGYNRTLQKIGTLRIEPYIKIPLKGIGTGSLPITSTGLNIGVVKKLF